MLPASVSLEKTSRVANYSDARQMKPRSRERARDLVRNGIVHRELDDKVRIWRTDQLAQNPAAERPRGSFVYASNRKVLRHRATTGSNA
jgi:hypothetical protein